VGGVEGAGLEKERASGSAGRIGVKICSWEGRDSLTKKKRTGLGPM